MLILTFDGFTPVVLSGHGGNFGATAHLDRMAAEGWTVDRAVVTRRRGRDNLAAWLRIGWPAGSITLMTDCQTAAADADCDSVGEVHTIAVDAVDDPKPIFDADTSLGRLLSAAGEVLTGSELDSASILWIHSDFLIRRWDGSTPVDQAAPSPEPEVDERPDFTVPLLDGEASDEELETMRIAADALLPADEDEGDEPLMPIERLDVTEPPSLRLAADDDPDLMVTWGQTYADQVALIDRLVPLTGSLAELFGGGGTTRVVAGTSGFSLGQNGWVAADAGPLRSGNVEVPWIVLPHPPQANQVSVRIAGPLSADELVAELAGGQASDLTARWVDAVVHRGDAMSAAVVIIEEEREDAITTRGWFHNRADGSLFLKPDDRYDVNDVSDRRQDVVEQLGSVSNGIHAT